ncbi:MAG: adenylate/guanylate cyclase domain-containing protein [Propionivibrio sp.]|uniref:adenylate/guanylate cyclase domain-containing protein n=1 Tax=Propionivibrio sp. TaxID=2212460 RepID=UPI001A3771D3|nr:adenylate/guanylate cyclase domain-containing protein [Propionivibrio sp.]MBL8413725.1 adenylate/guanylate cyclase domain-containing protein [Propionivibrio sp.]
MNDANCPLSVLFADVSGSVRLHERLVDAEALRAVDRCLKRMERAVEVFGGRIVKTVGDELMAVFDKADEALQAAIEMQQRVADLPPVSGVKLAIRVGFSHGPVNVKAGSYAGETVNAAAQLSGLAKPGQVLTSLQAQSTLSPLLKKSTHDLGSVEARGKSPGMNIFETVDPITSTPVAKIAEVADERNGYSQRGLFLRLRYGAKVVTLNDKKRIIRMGRGMESDIVIHDPRASRNHARLESQGDRVVLIDNSTNGTFVTMNGKPELFLLNEEFAIHGKGLICFADSASNPDADSAEFELL